MADTRNIRQKDWPKGLYRRAQSYRFQRIIAGRWFVQVLGIITLDEAKRKTMRLNFEIDEGGDIKRERERVRKTFSVHAREWLLKKEAALGATKSIRRYKAVIDNFTLFLMSKHLEKSSLDEIDYAVCDDYITHRRVAPIMPNGQRLDPKSTKFTRKNSCKHGAAKKTLYEEKGLLKNIFKEAVKRNLISRNPWDEVVVVKPKQDEIIEKHHPLTVPECKALIAAAVKVDQKQGLVPSLADIITFAVNTGFREDEICKLLWSDVSLKEGLIHVRRKKVIETRQKADGQVETIEYEWKPKATQGDVPMNETVRALLERLHKVKKSNFVFAQGDGGSCRLRLLRLTQRAAKLAGIKKIRFHDLRHTYGTLLREKGVAVEVIMQLMRHADIKETLLYAKPSNHAAQEAVKLLDVA